MSEYLEETSFGLLPQEANFRALQALVKNRLMFSAVYTQIPAMTVLTALKFIIIDLFTKFTPKYNSGLKNVIIEHVERCFLLFLCTGLKFVLKSDFLRILRYSFGVF